MFIICDLKNLVIRNFVICCFSQCVMMKSAHSEAMLQFESPVGMISVYVDNVVFVLQSHCWTLCSLNFQELNFTTIAQY